MATEIKTENDKTVVIDHYEGYIGLAIEEYVRGKFAGGAMTGLTKADAIKLRDELTRRIKQL
jgi:hypothetical protein